MALLTNLIIPSGVLSLAGGTMTGTLLLDGNQTQENAAATIGYLDSTSGLLTTPYSSTTDITLDSQGRVIYFKTGDYEVANISYTTVSNVANPSVYANLYVQQRVNSYTETFGGYSQNVTITYNNTSTAITSVSTTVI